MTLSELRAFVRQFVQDAAADFDFEDDVIDAWLNQGVADFAAQVDLPDLEDDDTVATDRGDAEVSTTYRARADNVATITTDEPHSLQVADVVAVATMGDATYDAAAAVVASVPTPYTFTYANTGTDETAVADTAGTVTPADDSQRAWVDLPADFMRDLWQCASETTDTTITINHSYRRFVAIDPTLDTAGSVVEVAQRGQGRLYYRAVPASQEVIRIWFRRAPTAMSDDADEPDGLPEQRHKAPAYFAAAEILDPQGLTGMGGRYRQLYQYQVEQAQLDFPADGLPSYVHDDGEYE